MQNYQSPQVKYLNDVQVGDAGPVLDVMAVMLENMSNITVMAQTLISTVYRAAQIVASIPNLSYQNKASTLQIFESLSDLYNMIDWFFAVVSYIIFWFYSYLNSLVFSCCIISSTTPSYGLCGPWNKGGRTPDIFCCSCPVFFFPPFLCCYFLLHQGNWYSKDTLKKCICIFFFSRTLWEIEKGAVFITTK